MSWRFWERKETKEGEVRFPGPQSLPQPVGSYLVVNENKNPDMVWKLKVVVRPTEKKGAFYCRVFDEAAAAQAGVKVKDWISLDEHLDLIIWEGHFDKETRKACPEKFVKPTTPTTK